MILLAWSLLIILSVVGVAGAILPAVPGIPLIFVGALVHKLILPEYLSWWVVAIVGVGAFVSWGLDLAGTIAGAKWGGASKAGLVGAGVGGLVGLLFGLPGLLVGPLLGAFLGELFSARRSVEEAVRSGIGAGLGLALSTVLRFLLGLALVILIFFDCVF